jgi:hypothetical protein
MTVTFNTSRSRFSETKRFTGVYQRMGQVAVDADWNEEVRLRTLDARRRTADVAEGAPDDGFRISADFVVDPIRSTAGWAATGLLPDDERRAVPELRLDRFDPETLPWVIRSRWHTALRRTLPAPVDLTALPRAESTPFAAAALIVPLRFERPPADEEELHVTIVVADADGREASLDAAPRGLRPSGWSEIVLTAADLAAIDVTRVTSWGVAELPPVARTWIGALRAVDGALGNDLVIRGGDGTVAGAGRMFVEGHRVFLERDLRYSSQPDLPEAPALPDLADGQHHFLYLDVWEQTVTGLDDAFLLEPALDGVDTAARLRTVAQVRALPLLASPAEELLPAPTGGGRLSTNIPAGDLPERNPPEPFDPCRDRCLFTENASTGDGYVGSDNLHVRVQVMRVGDADVALWSRDNASTVLALTRPTAPDSTTLRVAPADAARLRHGDVVVIEDRATRLRWDAPQPPVLRRLRGVQADTGILELDDAGATLTTDPVPLPVGGPVGRVFLPANGATVRRWDGADLIVAGARYRLSDGITFAFAGTGFRPGDYWTFTARVHAPDGAATGVVETLTDAAPHGPVHAYAPLARVRTGRPIEDLRRRYLPLAEVRDRLQELGSRRFGPGVFVVVVGDGVRTFGDVDQSLSDGLTADEAIQAALGLLGDQGGSIFIRAGHYQLEQPVLVRAVSSVRILGDGDATLLDVRGGGGAFYLDRCGAAGAVTVEDLHLLENPRAAIDIGPPDLDVDRPSFRVRTLFDKLIEARFSPVALPAERPLGLDDIRVEGGVPDFLGTVGARLKALEPGEGRAAGSVVATVIALRRLQRQHPETTLEHLPEAQPLLGALSALPHGVVTVADSRQVAVRGCRIEARQPGAAALGVMVTGTCGGIEIVGNRIVAATGVAALPYAPYMANGFLAAFPRAGLSLDGFVVADNDILATTPVTGVHVADGRLSGTAIVGNLVSGYTVGILVDDQAEFGRDAATDRIAVRDNRVVGTAAVGIQVTGDGVDVAGNEVQNAGGDAPFQAGIQVTGHSSRVVDCWIEVPAGPALSPLALLAGVVVGEGFDDGTTPSRPVYDVEVAGNRIQGSGADTSAIGVVVGGSHPIYDVRVRDNVLRDLGDAAVRTWSTAAPVGRLQVEGNRIERVALGDPAAEADNAPLLERLQPGLAATLPANAARRPRTLLAALVDSALPGVRAPLDAALRWVERLSLRGAIVLAGVESGAVVGNHVAEVGRSLEFDAPNVDGAEIRTAAIAVLAAAEVVVEDNAIEAVRAPQARLAGPGGDGGSSRPEMLGALQALGLGPAAARVDRGDVHLAAADLRARVLAYVGAAVDRRDRLAVAMFGALDALGDELAELDGAPGELSEGLVRESRRLRSAATEEEQTATANALRATLAQVAGATAPDEASQDAWDAASQLDLSSTRDAEAVRAVANRLNQRAETLTQGLAEAVRAGLTRALARLVEEPESLKLMLASAQALGQVATLRDQQARKKDLPNTTDLVGPRRTIVTTFAEAAVKQIDALEGRAAANVDRIEELRKAKDTLVDQLRDVSGGLASDLAADFQDVDRTRGRVKGAVTRLRGTLEKIGRLAGGDANAGVPSPEDAARGEAQARAATIQVYARSLDRQIGGLSTESGESAQKSLASFHGLMGQLGGLVSDQPDLKELADQATGAVKAAADNAAQRGPQLGLARSLLERLRGRLVDVLPPPAVPAPAVSDPIERRLAALGALAIEIDSASGAELEASLAAFTMHLERALDLAHADAGDRQRARDTIAGARDSLGGAPGPVRARAVHALLALVDDAATRAQGAGIDTPGVAAAATLLHAAVLASDTEEDEEARVTRARSFLAERTARLSAALVARAQQVGDAPGLVALLHDGLARVARGTDLVTFDDRPPAFEVAPAPADGIFAAGVERRARIAGNLVTEAVSGIVVLGAGGHLVTEPADDGMMIEVGGNRLSGCASVGLVLRLDGSCKALVAENQMSGCAGLAVPAADPWGHAVALVSGAGDLVVRGNVLSDNGNGTLRALLHELVVDWRGPVGVRSNTVRHLGGGAGGAGIVVLTEPVDAALIGRLARAPFLGAEPAPRTPVPRPRPFRPELLSIRELAPHSALSAADDVIELGGFKQVMATTPILQRALTLPAVARPAPTVATAQATRYVERGRTFLPHPIIDFLHRPPLVFVPPRVARAFDSVQVEGNDVEAAGPALLLLSEGNTLIAANVAANELRSRGGAGAVYVRRTDSTLFTGNRCECLEVVTVVVLRPGKAPVSATGNVIVGAEPVHQISVPPVTRAPLGGVQLEVGVGAGTIKVPIDARALVSTLDRRRNLAADAFSELLADLPMPAPPAPPGPAGPGGRLGAVAVRPPLGGPRGVGLSSGLLDETTRASITASLPAGIGAALGARTLYGHSAGAETDPTTALRKVVDRVALHETDAIAAKAKVGAVLSAAAGDPIKALKLLDENVLGLDTAKPTVKEALSNVSLLHEALGDVLAAESSAFAPFAPVPRPAPPPVPSDHSLVIIGGTRVAAVGNATTAGVLVQDADAHVELNP